jgi:hypothetical protein
LNFEKRKTELRGRDGARANSWEKSQENSTMREGGKLSLIWNPITGKSFSSQLQNDERVFRKLSVMLKIHIFPMISSVIKILKSKFLPL